MAKRLTSIRLSERTDGQISELTEKTGHDFTELVTIALERMYSDEMRRSHAMIGPIYTRFYTMCNDGVDGAFPVHFPDFSGETDGAGAHLHEATLEEIVAFKQDRGRYPTIYVRVEHELKYPYAKWDCYDTRPDDLWSDLYGKKFVPEEDGDKFCEAAIVATPSMALI